jgi:hypothetical protein
MKHHIPAYTAHIGDRIGWVLLAVMAALWLDHSVAYAGPIMQDSMGGTNIWTVILLVMAAATVVERATELIWNYVEWLLLNFRNVQPSTVRAPQYVQFKSGTSLLFGVVLGILVANFTGMRIIEHFQPFLPSLFTGIPAAWDILITGVLIAATAKPVHDLLGIMTQFKHLLGYSAIKQREGATSALADGVLKLAQSDAQAMMDVPGIGPTRLGGPGVDEMGAEGDLQPSDVDRYIDTLQNRTAM